MRVKKIEKLMIAGLSIQTNNANEINEENAKIPTLWNDYLEQNYEGKIFNKAKGRSMYGVYSKYESDVTGDYTVTLGIEVTKPKNAIVIKNQRYLVFTRKGELPGVVSDAWTEVWEYFSNAQSEYKRAYTIDFEKYAKEDEIEIYISIL